MENALVSELGLLDRKLPDECLPKDSGKLPAGSRQGLSETPPPPGDGVHKHMTTTTFHSFQTQMQCRFAVSLTSCMVGVAVHSVL